MLERSALTTCATITVFLITLTFISVPLLVPYATRKITKATGEIRLRSMRSKVYKKTVIIHTQLYIPTISSFKIIHFFILENWYVIRSSISHFLFFFRIRCNHFYHVYRHHYQNFQHYFPLLIQVMLHSHLPLIDVFRHQNVLSHHS